jgi:hypothetical protein
MQKLGCPESYTEPRELYRMTARLGMTAATITDHNVIDGCLEIADLPNTFISEEATVYFPEDRCKVHVLTYDITEAQHTDITRVRENIYEFVEYVRAQGIKHVLAHPLFGVNDRLTMDHVERLILLFKNFEINGDQNGEANLNLQRICERLTPEIIERLAIKHGFAPAAPEIWRKNFTGGSDDHSSLHLARTYTEVMGATTLEEFWGGVHAGRARIVGREASPKMLAHNVYGVAYQFFKDRFELGRFKNRDLFLKFLEQSLLQQTEGDETLFDRLALKWRQRKRSRRVTIPDTLTEMFRSESEKIIKGDPKLLELVHAPRGEQRADTEDRWFEFVNRVSNRVLAEFGVRTIDRVMSARFFDIFHSIGSAGSLYAMLAPYFVAYSLHVKVRNFSKSVLAEFGTPSDAARVGAKAAKLAHFTDTFYDVNGVAYTLQQQARTALNAGKDYVVITCEAPGANPLPNVRHFEPVGTYALPEYENLTLKFPPFLEILDFCYQQGITHLHSSTPGPLGLAALAVSRILN